MVLPTTTGTKANFAVKESTWLVNRPRDSWRRATRTRRRNDVRVVNKTEGTGNKGIKKTAAGTKAKDKKVSSTGKASMGTEVNAGSTESRAGKAGRAETKGNTVSSTGRKIARSGTRIATRKAIAGSASNKYK